MEFSKLNSRCVFTKYTVTAIYTIINVLLLCLFLHYLDTNKLKKKLWYFRILLQLFSHLEIRNVCMPPQHTFDHIWYTYVTYDTISISLPKYFALTRSMPWLSTPWLLPSSNQQQPRYWQHMIHGPLDFRRKQFNCLHHPSSHRW